LIGDIELKVAAENRYYYVYLKAIESKEAVIMPDYLVTKKYRYSHFKADISLLLSIKPNL
jgi:hypothetical protein